jgi:hypothetical protein
MHTHTHHQYTKSWRVCLAFNAHQDVEGACVLSLRWRCEDMYYHVLECIRVCWITRSCTCLCTFEHVGLYVCMDEWKSYVCMSVCWYSYMYLCVFVCKYLVVKESVYVQTYNYARTYTFEYISMCVYMYKYTLSICIHVFTHTHCTQHTAHSGRPHGRTCMTTHTAFPATCQAQHPAYVLAAIWRVLSSQYTHCPPSRTCPACIASRQPHATTHSLWSDVRPWNTPSGSVVIWFVKRYLRRHTHRVRVVRQQTYASLRAVRVDALHQKHACGTRMRQ